MPDRWKQHWRMVSDAVQDVYAQHLRPDDVLIFSLYLRTPVQEFRQQYPGQRLIVYQAEPLLGSEHYWPRDNIINNIRDADEIWDYDIENCQVLADLGLPVRFRPLRASSTMRRTDLGVVRDIDVLVYGLFSERRGQWLHELHMGMNPDRKIYTVCNVMHPELDRLIDRSRVVVNWHQHPDQNQQEQTRISYLLANGKHVVTETSSINYYGDLVQEFTTRDEMIESIVRILDQYHPQQELDTYADFQQLDWDHWQFKQIMETHAS